MRKKPTIAKLCEGLPTAAHIEMWFGKIAANDPANLTDSQRYDRLRAALMNAAIQSYELGHTSMARKFFEEIDRMYDFEKEVVIK